MKFYCLKHPEKGYLTSNLWFRGGWSNSVSEAKLWRSISHVKSLQKQTRKPYRKECSIVELEMNLIKITEL